MPGFINKSQIIVGLVLMTVFGGSLFAFMVNVAYWPFVPYSMFASISALRESGIELIGQTETGHTVKISRADFPPFHREEVLRLLRRARLKGAVDEARALEGLRNHFNKSAAARGHEPLLKIEAAWPN